MPMKNKNVRIKALPPKWQICTEGVTEANYFAAYVKVLNIEKHVTVNCAKARLKGCGRQHEALLDKMQECGRLWSPIRERIFLVHDYDRAAEQSNEKDSFNKTFLRMKEESNYYIIYSNPCFEYWLLLHTDYYDSNLHRHICQSKVEKLVNEKRNEVGLPKLHGDEYKTDPNLFEYFGGLAGSQIARRNARARFTKEQGINPTGELFSSIKHAELIPCTNIFELLNALDTYAADIHNQNS